MPIVSVIERKSLKGRSLLALVYLLLVLGGITTVYPFLLMMRLSTADTTDDNTLTPLPSYLWDSNSLAKKYMLKRYFGLSQNPYAPEVQPYFGPMPLNGPEWTVSGYGDLPNFWAVYFSQFSKLSVQGQRRQIEDYDRFLGTLQPLEFATVDWDVDPSFLSFKEFMEQRLHLPKAKRDIRYLVRPDAATRDWHPHFDGSYALSLEYKRWTKPQFRRPLYPAWVNFLKAKYGQFDVSKLDRAYGANYRSWTELRFPLTEPVFPPAKADYREFILKGFPHIWTVVHSDHQREWTAFLRGSQRLRSPADWRKLTGLDTPSIEAIPFTAAIPSNEGWALEWSRFVDAKVGVEDRELRSPDRQYVAFLQSRYGSIAELDRAWGTQYRDWSEVGFAEMLSDYRTILDHGGGVRAALTLRPFEVALGYLTSQSRAILNTAFLMVMALIAALTVNPLAAYALSRFKIRGSHKILLFFLATMALPAEVAMVPSFLLIKNLGLMNNYLALVLPATASAFGIFLLKGFFDSLPMELYEAATLDGAKELTIFLRITIPLSKPILAVTAMGAVLGAYGTFVPALLYLQNIDLWPIMPRLFYLTTEHDVEFTYGVNMAALVIGSIPTFLVFLFAQRQIMKGIILPSFK